MYFDANHSEVPHAKTPKQRRKNAVTSNRVLAPAEPLGITPCCTRPRDKGDTFQANAQKAHSHLRFHVFLHMNTHLSCCTELLKFVHDLYQNLITSNFDFVFKCFFVWLTTPRFHTQKPRSNEEKRSYQQPCLGHEDILSHLLCTFFGYVIDTMHRHWIQSSRNDTRADPEGWLPQIASLLVMLLIPVSWANRNTTWQSPFVVQNISASHLSMAVIPTSASMWGASPAEPNLQKKTNELSCTDWLFKQDSRYVIFLCDF